MATPVLKIYNPQGEYVAACKFGEDAACLMALYGDGATVRYEHKLTLWTEGEEDFPAGESYDRVNAVMEGRKNFYQTQKREEFRAKHGHD